ATDNCDTNVSVICIPPSDSFFPLGLTVVTCIATDACGNAATGSFSITVNDGPPQITCPADMTVKCDTPLSALSNLVTCTGITPGFDVRVYDTVSGAGNINPIGNLLGNPAFTPDVYSNPVFDYANFAAMQADYPGLTDGNTYSLAWLGIMEINPADLGVWTLGTASDDGSMIFIDLNKDGDFADPGELIVDNNGNHGRRERTGEVCFFTPGCYPIVIAMYEATGGENMEAKFGQGAGLAYGALSFIDGSATSPGPFYRSGTETPVVATAFDPCDANVAVSFEDVLEDGDCQGESLLIRTWTAVDSSGAQTQCVQTISLVDTQPPSIDGSIQLTLQCNTNGGFAEDGTIANFFASLNVVDNCDPNPDVDLDSVPAFVARRCPNQAGADVFLVTLTDDCENEAEVELLVRVVDSTPPVITFCPADVTLECGEDTSPSNNGVAAGFDICDPDISIDFSDGATIGQCPSKVSITRTWRLIDDCNNSAVCTQTILVEDTTEPEISGVPADLTLECTDPIPPLSTDGITGFEECLVSGFRIARQFNIVAGAGSNDNDINSTTEAR
ncbi:MAG: HYR domain-containing protein, partial [Verrucomicrobiota bacterium]